MELQKAQLPSRRIHIILSLGLLLVCSHFSSPVLADGFLCDAVQSTNKDLPRLEPSCPIGKGVWGKKVPPKGNDFYWIQCGLLPKPMTLAEAKPLYSKITTDVWMKPESSGYRCLIGPYLDPYKAAADLRDVKTLPNYKEAFIRVVGKSPNHANHPARVENKPAATPKPPVNASSVGANADAFQSEVTKAAAKPAVKKSATQPKLLTGNDDITVRLKTSLQGKTYVVPYLVENRNQFYMENGTPWNRLNYEDSSQICRQLDMSLATHEEFKALLSSGVMEKKQWPLQLPYWGENKIGLFADRAPNQLTGTSLLNVLCVQ